MTSTITENARAWLVHIFQVDDIDVVDSFFQLEGEAEDDEGEGWEYALLIDASSVVVPDGTAPGRCRVTEFQGVYVDVEVAASGPGDLIAILDQLSSAVWQRVYARANESLRSWPPGWVYSEVDDDSTRTVTYDTLREEHVQEDIEAGIAVTVDARGHEVYAVHVAGLQRPVSCRAEAVAEYDRAVGVLQYLFATQVGPVVHRRLPVSEQPTALETFGETADGASG